VTVDELQVVITANTASLKTAMTGVNSAMDKVQQQAKKAGDGMGKSFEKAGKTIATAGKIISVAIVAGAVAGFKLVESASNLVEAQNVVETTFKKSGKAIEAWTNGTAKSAGIGKTNATQWVGFMGAMLKSSGVSETSSASMSKNLVQLTGDMSSFYNVSTSDMWEKLRSGISGETEPLKAIGINMSVANLQAYALAEGFKKPYSAMSQGEQTTLRYNYLMKVTKDAQGDFAKTLGTSFANQVRVAQLNLETLGQSIGMQLLPAFNSMLTWVNNHMPAIQAVMKIVFDAIGKAVRAVADIFKIYIIPAFNQFKTWVVANMPQIQNIIKGASNIIKSVLKVISDFVVNQLIPTFKAMKQWFTDNFPKIKDAVMKAYNYIKPSFDNLVQAIRDNVIPIVMGMLDTFKRAMPGIKAVCQMVFPVVVAVIKAAIDIITTIIRVVGTIYQGIKPELDAVAGIFSGVFGTIKLAIQGVIDLIHVFNGITLNNKTATISTVTSGTGLVGRAIGDNDWQGGIGLFNEVGGEIMNLPNHTQIIPHDVSMEMAKNSRDNNGLTLSFDHVVINGYDDVKRFARDMYYAQQDYAIGRGGVTV